MKSTTPPFIDISKSTELHHKKRKKYILRISGVILGFLSIFAGIAIYAHYSVVSHHYQEYFDVSDIPEGYSIAIVFGAGIYKSGAPSGVLEDRLKTAIDLYNAGKVQVLLMSGDNRVEDYNEPQAMEAYAREYGIPDDAIILDYAGRRTYDTCYRALSIFQVTKAILVTQEFHMDRALYICNAVGVSAVGMIADKQRYKNIDEYELREVFARILAWWDTLRHIESEIGGNSEPIEL